MTPMGAPSAETCVTRGGEFEGLEGEKVIALPQLAMLARMARRKLFSFTAKPAKK
jgi:hypothetical protein